MIQYVKETALGPMYRFLEHPLRSVLLLLTIVFLTVLTQIAGLLLWTMLPVLKRVRAKCGTRLKAVAASIGVYLAAYLLTVLLLVPALASLNGRVPLPWFATDELPLKPHTILYPLLARNYVRADFMATLERVSRAMRAKYPKTSIRYLDAGFPLINGFPLLPHLSHNDGRKVDFSYFYKDAETGKPVETGSPSFSGYWAYEAPGKNEYKPCEAKASMLRWDFDWLQPLYESVELDNARTGFFLRQLAGDRKIQRILIEPHLKKRMGLTSGKIRFQGCKAARHDDHIHAQIEW